MRIHIKEQSENTECPLFCGMLTSFELRRYVTARQPFVSHVIRRFKARMYASLLKALGGKNINLDRAEKMVLGSIHLHENCVRTRLKDATGHITV